MKYQICIIKHDIDEHGNEITVVTAKHDYTADSLRKAYEHAKAKHGNSARVYPLATADDGESLLILARRALSTYEKWERRNEHAVMEPFKRSTHDREDYTMLAVDAILSAMAENPAVDMYTASALAFKAIATAQKRRERNSERVYNPDWNMDNLQPTMARATFPELDSLIKNATETANLTAKQAAVIALYAEGQSMQTVAETMGITKATAQKVLYSAEYKVLCRALEIDAERRIFTAAGYTAEDIAETVEKMRKRARVK